MKKFLLLLSMLMPSASFAEVVHLNCSFTDPAHNIVKDVVVDFMDFGANISVDGASYAFTPEYEARAAFYSDSPWMRLEVGNHRFTTKYTFATMIDDMPVYLSCQEI